MEYLNDELNYQLDGRTLTDYIVHFKDIGGYNVLDKVELIGTKTIITPVPPITKFAPLPAKTILTNSATAAARAIPVSKAGQKITKKHKDHRYNSKKPSNQNDTYHNSNNLSDELDNYEEKYPKNLTIKVKNKNGYSEFKITETSNGTLKTNNDNTTVTQLSNGSFELSKKDSNNTDKIIIKKVNGKWERYKK
jgi:hypothetical protein